ncbi:MAG: 4Fe-4S dicluster domain-containing protein [Sphaerochaetaceae bacterium]|jgi:[FeFe] hydrogenase (group B1/B3)|nr:4Fe-4S dicluster domain-containing protein [Sphaerochaetaceae bacterium]
MNDSKRFDTKVQELKYKVLREVARHAYNGDLLESLMDIPKEIIPGKKPTTRCCVYKERAIVGDRIKMAMGGDRSNHNIIQVIETACDECPVGGYEVTSACRGCLSHRCEQACKRGAISFDEHQKAKIDKTKCVECGRCSAVCPYSAIHNYQRPCQSACKVKAIDMNDQNIAVVNNDKCISCGSCVYMCPFGAIMDASFIVDVIELIKKSQKNTRYKTYAIVAPAISSQFTYASLGQVVSGLKALGFYHVIETALGADLVAWEESKEIEERGLITSSCCPAFVSYISKAFPAMADRISSNPSPMVRLGMLIKQTDPTAKVIFIGPCTAKKMEFQRPDSRPYVDGVLTFEELQAIFDSKDIELGSLKEDVLDNASYFGRIFARSGGLSEAAVQAAKERGSDLVISPTVCNGIEDCKKALLLASKGLLKSNFIEGMACMGGCIGGAGCLTHEEKDKSEVDRYGRLALEKTIKDAISIAQEI